MKIDPFVLSALREELEDRGIKPNKRLGQNFLIDRNVALNIVRISEVGSDDTVVEIGCGAGALTSIVLTNAGFLLGYEVDRKLCEFLFWNFADYPRTAFLHKDFTEADVPTDLGRFGQSPPVKIISNLPYYISSQVITKLAMECYWESCTLMVQKEVAERLMARPCTRVYGSLTVLLQYCCKVEQAAVVSPSVFYPKPEVFSAVLRIFPRKLEADVTPAELSRVVRGAFGQRRKSIWNSLSGTLGIDKDTVYSILASIGIQAERRAESLSLEEFVNLARAFRYIPSRQGGFQAGNGGK
ncbi:MAG: 16S rRNA (adenine(1518)-N(6)/adenine(1519)-N(6))-dimethyltransferase RsmA [Bacillota bacterium]